MQVMMVLMGENVLHRKFSPKLPAARISGSSRSYSFSKDTQAAKKNAGGLVAFLVKRNE